MANKGASSEKDIIAVALEQSAEAQIKRDQVALQKKPETMKTEIPNKPLVPQVAEMALEKPAPASQASQEAAAETASEASEETFTTAEGRASLSPMQDEKKAEETASEGASAPEPKQEEPLTQIETARSRIFGLAGSIKEKATNAASTAQTLACDANTAALGRLGDMKARGLDAIKFAKDIAAKTSEGIVDQVASGKASMVARISDIKAHTVEMVASVKKTSLEFKSRATSNIAVARGYVADKVSTTKTTASKVIAGAQARVLAHVTYAQSQTMHLLENSKARAKLSVAAASTKAAELNTKAKEVAADPKAKTAAAGAAGGAVALGATGGAVGMASGTLIGATVGLVPAIFTFGLSIPIGAAIGGGAGLCVGTAVGGTTGLVAGGAAGYKKDDISSGTKKILASAGDGLQYTKDTAGASRQYVVKQVNSSATYLRARVQRISGTGGTENMPAESD